MGKVKFADAFSTDSPPISKRRKTEPIPPKTWKRWKTRIEELYRQHELKEVKEMLAREGFAASEKQLATHLEEWGGNAKYLKLSDRQWIHVAQKTMIRLSQDKEKKTAVRWSASKEIIPGSRIRKGLERRLAKSDFYDAFSVCGSISSHGLSIFTSSTNGFKIKNGIRLLSRLMNFQGTSDATSDPRIGILDRWQPFAVRALKARYPNDSFYLKMGPTSGYELLCLDCPDFSINFRRSSDPTRLFEGIAPPNMGLPPDDLIISPSRYFNSLEEVLNIFERHLNEERHCRRVELRILGNPGQWSKRDQFVRDTGLTCGHDVPPPDVSLELEKCWTPGGCRWSQLKTVEDQEREKLVSQLSEEANFQEMPEIPREGNGKEIIGQEKEGPRSGESLRKNIVVLEAESYKAHGDSSGVIRGGRETNYEDVAMWVQNHGMAGTEQETSLESRLPDFPDFPDLQDLPAIPSRSDTHVIETNEQWVPPRDIPEHPSIGIDCKLPVGAPEEAVAGTPHGLPRDIPSCSDMGNTKAYGKWVPPRDITESPSPGKNCPLRSLEGVTDGTSDEIPNEALVEILDGISGEVFGELPGDVLGEVPDDVIYSLFPGLNAGTW